MYKIYSLGNYFVIEVPGKPEPLQDAKSDVRLFLMTSGTEKYSIKSPLIGSHEIELAEMEDQGGTPYTSGTFETFYSTNSGFNTASGGSGAIRVIGFWDAATNSPDLSLLTLASGEAYQVSVPGTTNLNGQASWAALDLAVWNDSLVGKWFKLDNTDDVLSVNGMTGAVVLNASNVGLSNVDNTSDANKPISTASQTALDGKKDDFAENSAFNKDFGTTAGTVLEGDAAVLFCLKSVYDPTNVNADAFDYENAIGITQITGAELSETLTGNTHDFNPTGFDTCNYLRLDMSNDRELTGFIAPAAGIDRIIRGVNVSDKKIKFQNNNSGSTAANRLLLKEYGDKDCKKGEPFAFKYDHISNRWRPFVRIG